MWIHMWIKGINRYFFKKLIFKKIVRQTARLWKKHFYNKQTYLKIEKLSIDIYSTYDYWYYNLEFHKIVLTKLSKIFKHLKYRYHTIKKKEEGWIQNLQYSLPFKANNIRFQKIVLKKIFIISYEFFFFYDIQFGYIIF